MCILIQIIICMQKCPIRMLKILQSMSVVRVQSFYKPDSAVRCSLHNPQPVPAALQISAWSVCHVYTYCIVLNNQNQDAQTVCNNF